MEDFQENLKNLNSKEKNIFIFSIRMIAEHIALRVPPAKTRLTVYRRFETLFIASKARRVILVRRLTPSQGHRDFLGLAPLWTCFLLIKPC